MKKFLYIMFVTFIALASGVSSIHAQQPAPGSKMCEGPSNLCSQIFELQSALDKQKKIRMEAEAKSANVDQVVLKTKQQEEQSKNERMAKLVAAAAVLAVALKLLISSLTAWKGYFKTDKQKAILKLSLLVLGFLVLILTNVGYGIPIWQSLILAGGGPGAMLVHEISKLYPVIRGWKKLDEEKDDTEKTDEPKKA